MDQTEKRAIQPKVMADITVINNGVVEVIQGEVVDLDYDGCLLRLRAELPLETVIEMRIRSLDQKAFEKFGIEDARYDTGIEFHARARVLSSFSEGMHPSAWITKIRYRGSIRIVRLSGSEKADT